MEFKKVLAKYYHKWFRDCYDSAVYCRDKGDNKLAEKYLNQFFEYRDIIINNWDAIEFFSVNDNAYKHDDVLPIEFRGYR